MRSVGTFLIGWVLLLGGVVLALWKTGVLEHVDASWAMIGLFVAIGLGIMLAVVRTRPPTIIQ